MKNLILLFFLFSITFTSCVSKKKYADLLAQNAEKEAISKDMAERYRSELNECLKNKKELTDQVTNLNIKTAELTRLQEETDHLKKTNNNLLDRLSDLSVISKSGSESIKKSLEALNEQSKYIKDLNTNMQRKDSVNLALVMNLKRSLADVNDEDVQVEVQKGVVYISISDKLLFKSGSASINLAAETVLEKVARVVNDHKELDILVEGHTDNVPMTGTCLEDNWVLSTKRATSVVRLLQNKFGVAPQRLTAGGRSEYAPKTSNETANGKKTNRRTEIIVTPKLDQFFNLLVPQK